jgi:hypothetical protein
MMETTSLLLFALLITTVAYFVYKTFTTDTGEKLLSIAPGSKFVIHCSMSFDILGFNDPIHTLVIDLYNEPKLIDGVEPVYEFRAEHFFRESYGHKTGLIAFKLIELETGEIVRSMDHPLLDGNNTTFNLSRTSEGISLTTNGDQNSMVTYLPIDVVYYKLEVEDTRLLTLQVK